MPRLLLDTRAFLWWIDDRAPTQSAASRGIGDVNTECDQLAIKSNLGKLQLAKPVERFVSEQLAANNFTLLNIELRHAAKIEKMPFHHRDPFDRLLIAQGSGAITFPPASMMIHFLPRGIHIAGKLIRYLQ